MDNVSQLPARHSQKLPATQPQTLSEKLRPASVTEVMAGLSTCLALVKPVGMSAEDADAWLRTATRELAHLPPDLLASGCRSARRNCTHHGQVVPHIIKETDEWLAMRRRYTTPVEKPVALPKPDRWHPTSEEIEALKRGAADQLKA